MFKIKDLSILLLYTLPLTYATQPEVTIEQGTVKGLYKRTWSNRKYASFEGIPYAKPPQGKHRFKEPVPHKAWLGIYNATKEPPKCLQGSFSGGSSGSEDCLYINVYTPQLPTEGQELLDVIAFIHGGGFFAMDSTFHKANILLDVDIIFVTFNYRLGPLGFLSAEDDVLPGNNGLKDQTLALKWIQRNIAAFGGNPESVTLAGISAGGASCHLHTLSPLSKGLFKGAMCMSGVGLSHWSVVENPKPKAVHIAHELGCPVNDTRSMVDCLRDRPAEHINAMTKDFWPWKFPTISFGPVIEPPGPKAFISERPIEIVKRKGAMDIPLLLSFTADEGLNSGAALHADKDLFTELMKGWNELAPSILLIDNLKPSTKALISEKIWEHYKLGDVGQERKVVKLIGDGVFLHGIGMLAELYSSLYTSPVYIYRFSYRGQHSLTEMSTKDDIGVSHGDDALYLTDTPLFSNFTPKDNLVAKYMKKLWTTFAATGGVEFDPNWLPEDRYNPQISFNDIIDHNNQRITIVEEIGEKSFWDSIFALISSEEKL